MRGQPPALATAQGLRPEQAPGWPQELTSPGSPPALPARAARARRLLRWDLPAKPWCRQPPSWRRGPWMQAKPQAAPCEELGQDQGALHACLYPHPRRQHPPWGLAPTLHPGSQPWWM